MKRYHNIHQMNTGPIILPSHAHSDNYAETIFRVRTVLDQVPCLKDSHYKFMHKYVAFHKDEEGEDMSCNS